MSENGKCTDDNYRYVKHQTWKCSNCGEYYEGGDNAPDQTCAWCNEYAGWKRIWKAECAECNQVYYADFEDEVKEKVDNCGHNPPWLDDTDIQQENHNE